MAKKRLANNCCDIEKSLCDGSGSVCRIEAVLGIDDRGQMVLPKEVREKAGIRTGDKLVLISWENDGKICCFALTKTENLNGMVKGMLSPLMNGNDRNAGGD